MGTKPRGGAALVLLVGVPLSLSAQRLAVRADTVLPMSGPPIPDGVVLVEGRRIVAVGPASQVRIPEGARVLRGRIATPGLIDAHATVGLSGLYNVPHDQDQLDRTDPIQPELRAVDGYNPHEALVAWLRSFGVTTVHTGHGPGALISGQTMVVKTVTPLRPEAVLDSAAMVAATLGASVGRTFRSPGTRPKGVAMLRARLLEAQTYLRQPRERNLRLEALAAVLRGEMPLLVTAHTATDIANALRLQQEFGFRLVLDGAADAPLMLEEIRRAGVPVILHPTMIRPVDEAINASVETAARLRQAGVLFALQSGYEPYVPKTRVVLFEAAMAYGYGLARDDALRAITLDAARILGVADRIGSLEVGKDADIVLFDGNPLEQTSHVCAVVLNGQVVSETCR